ncbi:MAG: exodeoxyribonuclease V subunit beta [Deltaproteobacteria bacterium]|nr:exodeoxyribonuclease V subunit beta [Deltaproteobacteria bacterium]
MAGPESADPGFQPFDLLQTPLAGTNLIEASAGTGKTYTLSRLFLRLLLEKELSVNEILVVTYTKAATEELRHRIRRLLLRTRSVLSGEEARDPFLVGLAERLGRPERALSLLDEAISHFDEAAIFTIHGFCQRLLEEKSFESGALFDTLLIPDQQALIEEIVQDFWRRHFYGAPPEWIAYARSRNLAGPAALMKILGQGLAYPDLFVEGVPASSGWNGLEGLRRHWQELRGEWPKIREEVLEKLRDPALNKNKIRQPEELGKELGAYLERPWADLPLPPRLGKFRAPFLRESVRKGGRPPEHPFFHEWERFWQEAEAFQERLEEYLRDLKAQAFRHLQEELTIRKGKLNLWSFDDLLARVRNALRDSGGEVLAAALRLRFKAALIDEFQDTDPVQYEIFSKVFSTEQTPLFLIGDPKQAIYGFRGADLFAYLKATREVGSRYTLTRNWRSVPGLIQAVNRLFSRRHPPFLVEEIPFLPASPALSEEENRLVIDGREAPPFQTWFLPAEKYGEPGEEMSKAQANRLIAAALGKEISRLLRLGRRRQALLGGKALRARDMAVLVRTHREARLVQETLRRLRIPSVLYSTDNLFDSPEALELSRLLAALAEPGRETLIRNALTTDLLGVNGPELERLAGLEKDWEDWGDRFRQYSEDWEAGGCFYLFRRLLSREGIRERLLRFPDGERRLTNLLHLLEVLHQAEVEKGLGRMELLRWLFHQRDPKALRLEEHQLRLESDAEALKIVTVHKSKGLEYPIVFCPFQWSRRVLSAGEPFLYHDEADGWRLHFVLNPERDPRRDLAERELLAENLRLLYVALTRARTGCYLVWGRVRGAVQSGPAYLLGVDGTGPTGRSGEETGGPAPEGDREFRRPLEAWAREAAGAVQVADLPEGAGRVLEDGPAPAPALSFREFKGPVPRDWRVASFSFLTRKPEARTGEVGVQVWEEADYDAEQEQEARPETAPQGLGAFPRGAAAGIFLHALLEKLDFTRAGSDLTSFGIGARLKAFGFETHWEPVLIETLNKVLTIPLEPKDPEFTLSRVPPADRLNELEFCYPLRKISSEKLARLIKTARSENRPEETPLALEELTFAPLEGFMKGFIDLVFRYEGRFYLADWKSNYLGAAPENYGAEPLARAMAEHHYTLQYLLYVLALNQYLNNRVPGYDYERHFGGVFYIFLRGVDPVLGPAYGIFRDRPSREAIETLSRELIAV